MWERWRVIDYRLARIPLYFDGFFGDGRVWLLNFSKFHEKLLFFGYLVDLVVRGGLMKHLMKYLETRLDFDGVMPMDTNHVGEQQGDHGERGTRR